jgi:hypothetical protein
MESIEYCGAVYNQWTDWLAFLKRAAHPPPPAIGLRDDLDVPSAVSALEGALAGTFMQVAMRAAIFRLLEDGSPEEVALVLHLGFEEAPYAEERIPQLLSQKRERFDAEVRAGILDRYTVRYSANDIIRRLVREECERPDRDEGIYFVAARVLPEWLLENLPLDDRRVRDTEPLSWLIRMPGEWQPRLLAAIAVTDPARARRMVEHALGPRFGPKGHEDFRRELSVDPAFARIIAEHDAAPR